VECDGASRSKARPGQLASAPRGQAAPAGACGADDVRGSRRYLWLEGLEDTPDHLAGRTPPRLTPPFLRAEHKHDLEMLFVPQSLWQIALNTTLPETANTNLAVSRPRLQGAMSGSDFSYKGSNPLSADERTASARLWDETREPADNAAALAVRRQTRWQSLAIQSLRRLTYWTSRVCRGAEIACCREASKATAKHRQDYGE
jgi:hypothetical protein